VILLPASIPSPAEGTWYLGPVPLRGYALMILLGMIAGLIVANRRWQQRGGRAGTAYDVAMWAIPFGIIGARLYHVVTDWQLYFAADGSGVVGAVQIWNGGLGIWGAVAGGFLGGAIACRRRGIPLSHFADAVAPSLVLAQAIGRWGNYLNQELFGRPSDLPWAVEIDPEHRPPGYEAYETFHATFLYESLWNFGVFFVLLWADRRWRIGYGRLFALYVALYCAGRVWIEALRIDTVNTVLGLRLNIWTSIIVGLAALAYMIISARRHPGRLEYVEPDPAAVGTGSAADAIGEGAADDADVDRDADPSKPPGATAGPAPGDPGSQP
jgi:prolipoprotein diacylglyceryl transferase